MKPKIALLIAGRATCWESCLLKVLNNSNDYDIDLFMSINNENTECNYFKNMKDKLSFYLKGIYINKYIVPSNFINTSTHPQTVKQLVNNQYVPLNILSMWYNYKNAFNMALEYERKNGFNYDYSMTFRSDIIIDKIPLFKMPEEGILYSINQPCQFISFGIHKVNIISPEWVFARQNTMTKYLETYDFILEQSHIDNNYICHYESNVTDNCIEKCINVHRITNIHYDVDKNRRMFDDWKNINDTRKINILNRTTDYVDIKLLTF
jgi:hypothetical protein